MLVEVVEGRCETREIRDKETREIKGITQEVYFHLPNSAFPVQGKIRIDAAHRPGKYKMQPCYRIGRFGDLEIDPFAVPKLAPATPEQVKAAG